MHIKLSNSEETNDLLPTFDEEPDTQSYNIHMDDPEELISIRDLCNDIIGECTFEINSGGPIDYYQEALESLQNGKHKIFSCWPSSEDLGVEIEEGPLDRAKLDDNDEAELDCADESTSFEIQLPGICIT